MLVMSAAVFSSCSDDQDGVYPYVKITCGESKSIKDAAGVTWESSNPEVAGIENGVLKTYHVGTATLSSSKGSFDVTVLSVSLLFHEPYTSFGSSLANIKTWMGRHVAAAEISAENYKTFRPVAGNDKDIKLISDITYSNPNGAAVSYSYIFTADVEYKIGSDGKEYSEIDNSFYKSEVTVKNESELKLYMTERYVVDDANSTKLYVLMHSVDDTDALSILMTPAVADGALVWNVAYTKYDANFDTTGIEVPALGGQESAAQAVIASF